MRQIALPTVIILSLLGVITGACRTAPQAAQDEDQLSEGEYTRVVKVNELTRSYLLYIPSGYDSTIPTPVILAFHGAWGTPKQFAEITDLDEQAGRAGFIAVFPMGYERSWNAGGCCGPAYRRDIDDLSFVKALLNDLASVVNVDPQRIFATGFSNGSMFTYRLACELSDRIAAIAPIGAAPMSDFACSPTRPVSVLHMHGLADRSAPFRGGVGEYTRVGEQRSVSSIIDYWIRENGCTDEARMTYKKGAAICIAHPNCAQNIEIILCTIAGMGHQWPGGSQVLPRVFGSGTDDISATEMIIQFFRSHPKR